MREQKQEIGESFRNLTVWQRAVEMTLEIYKLTAGFPDSERFGLTSQLRRAAVSVASNIAEGYGRATTRGEYVQFLGHARGSISEVETQLFIAGALGYGSKEILEDTEQLCSQVGRMLRAMMKSLQTKPAPAGSASRSLVPSP